MSKDILINQLKDSWQILYGSNNQELLISFIEELETIAVNINLPVHQQSWYKDAIVYSLYVDLFNTDFKGLQEKLNYLKELGVSCLWLLPILESPMKDAGFDISDYKKIRRDLLGQNIKSDNEAIQAFRHFLDDARNHGMKVIFDIAMNHTSDQHPWFQEARKSVENPYRDYYIWNEDTNKYQDARLLFKGMCPSNWEKDGKWYFFHRFFEFQPDLNFKNPKVLIEMTSNLLYWLQQGVDGFRADAIPYLWKEEGTDCENLPNTHVILKFFRAALDYVRPNTLLLAEACQKPHDIIKYLETEDECNAGYHFPLMPQIFKALSKQSSAPIINTLNTNVTPSIPESSQWFTFLRCHDELSLELIYVSEEDRKYIHENYCHKPEWDFRVGEGVSARLSELMKKDVNKISAAFSLMLSLPGTPVIYYGDEFGKLNDKVFYQEMIKLSGKDDTRFLVRGRIDWDLLKNDMKDPENFHYKVFHQVSNMIKIRKKYKAFGRGSIKWLSNNHDESVLSFLRSFKKENILIIQNMTDKNQEYLIPEKLDLLSDTDILGNKINRISKNTLIIEPFNFHWCLL